MSGSAPGPGNGCASGKAFDVVGIGLNSVDHLCVVKRHPRLDSKQQLVAYDVQPGGQVPTALVALQRWGLRTAYMGSFGDDAGGQMSRAALAAEGIDLSAAPTRTNTRQQVSVILVDETSGERSVLSERVEALVLRRDEVRYETAVAGRALLMDAVDVAAATEAARRARDAGVLTILDTDNPTPGIDTLLRLTDVLIVPADFPGRLTGMTDLRRALRAAAAHGPWFVGVTLGPGGALAFVRGEFHYVPAFRVPVVDSTGAGDIFHAGSIYGLLHGWPAADTLRFAAAAAALKCEKLGGRPGIPTLERALALARGGRGIRLVPSSRKHPSTGLRAGFRERRRARVEALKTRRSNPQPPCGITAPRQEGLLPDPPPFTDVFTGGGSKN